MKKIYIIIVVLLLSACAAKKVNVIVISQADADRGAAKFPGTTIASLTQGKSIYENNCQSCHQLYSPASRTEAKWRKVVPEMVVNANKNAGKASIPIDSEMQESILRYVITMSSAPATAK